MEGAAWNVPFGADDDDDDAFINVFSVSWQPYTYDY